MRPAGDTRIHAGIVRRAARPGALAFDETPTLAAHALKHLGRGVDKLGYTSGQSVGRIRREQEARVSSSISSR